MRDFKSYELLNAKNDTGVEKAIQVDDFRHVVFSLNTNNSANLTVQFQGSIQEEKPDFEAAQSADNSWDYIQVKDLEDGTSIDGDTGVSASGSDDHRIFEANINGLRWIAVNVTSATAGDVTVRARVFEN